MSIATRRPLVAAKTFILATRDTGYRSTGSAISELVDNSLEAGASKIDIHVNETRDAGARQLSIVVIDNGCGMDAVTLRAGLQFGGTERFNSRTGMGRYGMGLPNASVSQCRRVDVYTWTPAGRHALHCYLDVDEIASGRCSAIPRVTRRRLPEAVARHAGIKGTAVFWSRCDRLDNRKASTIAQKLSYSVGRRFRYFIWSGGLIRVNGRPIEAVDPLYQRGSLNARGAVEYCAPLTFKIRVPGQDRCSEVKVRFAVLPVDEWHSLDLKTKRDRGIVGGAGVSVVRAGREIDYGWHFLGGKRRQNYDDWWRAELSFEPDLDELFGVTHSKQEIMPTPELNAILAPDLEAIARQLSLLVRSRFASLSETGGQRVKAAERRDWQLLPLAPRSRPSGRSLEMHYRLVSEKTGERAFFRWEMNNHTLYVTVNEDHPFFSRYMSEEARLSKDDAALLLLSAARAEAQQKDKHGCLRSFRVAWSDVLAAFLA